MKYVHRSVIVCHGYLTGWRCLIDKHFTLKISELAFKRIAEEMVQEAAKPATRAMFKEHTAFWTAPEDSARRIGAQQDHRRLLGRGHLVRDLHAVAAVRRGHPADPGRYYRDNFDFQ